MRHQIDGHWRLFIVNSGLSVIKLVIHLVISKISVEFQDCSKSYGFNLISPLLERYLSNLVKHGLGVRVNLRMSEALRI